MKIKIFIFGKIKNTELRILEEYYFKLAQKHFKVEIVELRDIKDRKVEFDEIEKYFTNGFNIILSEDGKEYSTKDFAQIVQKWKMDSIDINIFVGNAFGFSEVVKQNSNLVLSLSKMTFPHELTLVILLEQLFRVGDILSGGKYHK
jgi:23S rRNA (pseudouridine1915-N3)-methyltransferase